jgi:regulatory protein
MADATIRPCEANRISRIPVAFEPDGKPRLGQRKPPRAVTLAYLQRAALAYLERYASSEENLRRVIRRKIDKRCRLRGEAPAPFYPFVDEVVERCTRAGFLDDTRYAEARVAALRRRGGSARAIQARLSAKGVGGETIATALRGGDRDRDADEEAAAHAFACRRKLGPYRFGQREPFRDKDMAALARAGFPFGIVRRVIEGAPLEDEAEREGAGEAAPRL